ncbi:MAG: hypothetical protein JRI79_09120 [Deltaproteobacteria bacterium]|nr:hypothetical protein [Deltaproteobacteria bacterium]MBW1978110.1 hypothetical protein [Deltaproteobacteria bacterium]MBW2301621.1 hypothetical protein [Deltaproteobacteria bacterium]
MKKLKTMQTISNLSASPLFEWRIHKVQKDAPPVFLTRWRRRSERKKKK